MKARVSPGSIREIGVLATLFSHLAGRVMHTEPPAVFTTLARTRRVFWGWLVFSGSLMPFGHLSRRESELSILRVAHLTGSTYEATHHRRIGRRAGLTDAEIESILGGESVVFSTRERAILSTIDTIQERQDLDDDEWKHLRQQLSEREVVELLMLIGQYAGLAQTLRILRIPLDRAKD